MNVRVAKNGHSIVKRESSYLNHSPCRERTLGTIPKRTENFISLVFHTREIASDIYLMADCAVLADNDTVSVI